MFWIIALVFIAIGGSLWTLSTADAQSRPPQVAFTVTGQPDEEQGLVNFRSHLRNNTRSAVPAVLEVSIRIGGVDYAPNVENFSPLSRPPQFRMGKPSVWWVIPLKKPGALAKQSFGVQVGENGGFCATFRLRRGNVAGPLLRPTLKKCYRSAA